MCRESIHGASAPPPPNESPAIPILVFALLPALILGSALVRGRTLAPADNLLVSPPARDRT